MSYWEHYTCDKCGLPFTHEEWIGRESPHDIDCPNYDPDDDIDFIECTCDRNYHSACFDFDNDPHREEWATDIEEDYVDRFDEEEELI